MSNADVRNGGINEEMAEHWGPRLAEYTPDLYLNAYKTWDGNPSAKLFHDEENKVSTIKKITAVEAESNPEALAMRTRLIKDDPSFSTVFKDLLGEADQRPLDSKVVDLYKDIDAIPADTRKAFEGSEFYRDFSFSHFALVDQRLDGFESWQETLGLRQKMLRDRGGITGEFYDVDQLHKEVSLEELSPLGQAVKETQTNYTKVSR
jgi:hypothetical protein